MTQDETLAKKFPKTYEALLLEMGEAKQRLQDLESVCLSMAHESISEDSLEIVIPQEHPNHYQGKGIGNDLSKCLDDAIAKSGRKGSSYGFINIGEFSISIQKEDALGIISMIQNQDRGMKTRVCWTKSKRGCCWLE